MYITFEGPDGVGKTTMSNLLSDYIKTKGINVLYTRHPGATPLGKKLREIVKHDEQIKLDPFTERILLLCDNSAFINTILIPELDKGNTVIADRCNFISDLPYGLSLGVPLDKIIKLHSALEAPKIDLLIFMKCSLDSVKYRMASRTDAKCKIESRGDDYMSSVANYYRDMTLPGTDLNRYISSRAKSFITVDTNKCVDEVWDQIRSIYDDYYNNYNNNFLTPTGGTDILA